MVVDFLREALTGARKNPNPDVVLVILCQDVERMTNLTPLAPTEQGTIEARQGKILL
jgi:hypothetical protein